MAGLWFRPSAHDRQALQSAVRSLGETSVAGLAVALSWRTRKVERLLVDELTRPGTSMAYDPARRLVRWAPPTAVAWSHPPPSLATPEPRPEVDLGPTLAAPPPVLSGGALRSQCPSCRVALVASSSPSLNVCPDCGRLFSSRTATSTPTPGDVGEAAASPAPAATPPKPDGPAYGDRRAQELLAAYVTASPIPCPRCHTRLQHRGVSEYVCPSCGETVRFGRNGATAGPRTGLAGATSPRHASR